MLEIYVARHGQDKDNAQGILNGHRDLPLTGLGIEQAHTLAQGIKDAGFAFDTVYTSPLRRASDTAKIICKTLGIAPPRVLNSLIERDFGSMTGQLVTDIERLCRPYIVKTDNITYFLSPSGGEKFPALFERAKRVLHQIQMEHKNGSVLLSTHGDFGKMLYGAYYNRAWEEMLTMFHFGNCELLRLAEGTSTGDSRVIKIKQHND